MPRRKVSLADQSYEYADESSVVNSLSYNNKLIFGETQKIIAAEGGLGSYTFPEPSVQLPYAIKYDIFAEADRFAALAGLE